MEYPKMGYSQDTQAVRSRPNADCRPVLLGANGPWEDTMPTNDPDRLRAALDQIANALQPAVLLAGELKRVSAATAQDAAAVDTALARVAAILKTLQPEQPE